jgi:hypothetical protein
MEPESVSTDHIRCSEPRKHASASASQSRRSHGRGDVVERYALTEVESAASLGMSPDTFRRHVKPHLRCVRIGNGQRMKYYFAPEELRRFVERQSSLGL